MIVCIMDIVPLTKVFTVSCVLSMAPGDGGCSLSVRWSFVCIEYISLSTYSTPCVYKMCQ